MPSIFKSNIGGADLTYNLNVSTNKINFIYPTIENIYCETNKTVPFNIGTTTFQVPTGNVSISDITASSTSNVDFKIFITGEIPLIDPALKTAGFGAGSSVTNAIMMFLELPTNDFSKIKFKAGTNEFVALTKNDVISHEGKCYLTNLKGVYDSAGITGEKSTFSLIYGPITKTYEFDYTNATLEI